MPPWHASRRAERGMQAEPPALSATGWTEEVTEGGWSSRGRRGEGHYEQRRKAGRRHELVCWERKTWKTHEAGWSFRCMQPERCYLDKWSLSAHIRIVNTPLTIIFPPHNGYLTLMCISLTRGLHRPFDPPKDHHFHLCMEKTMNATKLQARSRSSEQTPGLANNV